MVAQEEDNFNSATDKSTSDRLASETKLVRQLKNRHVAMIRYVNLPPLLVNVRRVRLSVLEASSAQVSSSSGSQHSYRSIPYSLFKAYSWALHLP